MFDMLQATCSSCEKGAWHFVRPDFGVFEPDFDETDVTWGEVGEWTCRLYTGVGTLVLDITHRGEC